jgi:glycosyltransferase involved in cell wall biosynthesis
MDQVSVRESSRVARSGPAGRAGLYLRAVHAAMNAPLVSVLVPARNAERTLAAALRSIERQSERDWECVIVDDGSRDGTLACARAFAARDPRFRALEAPPRGLVEALNLGLAHCRARYIARLDADDIMHRARLAVQRRVLDDCPALAAVGSHVRVFPRRRLRAGFRHYERWLNSIENPDRVRAEAFVECPVVHPTLMARAPVLRALGYRDLGWPEDYDLVLRLLTAGHEVAVVPRRLVGWRDGPERLTRVGLAYRLHRITAVKAAFLATHFLAASETYILWGYGSTARRLRRALLGHGKRPSHVVEVHPGRLGQTIHGAPVISVTALLARAPSPLIASVAGATPRGQIRDVLRAHGWRETLDFVCAA